MRENPSDEFESKIDIFTTQTPDSQLSSLYSIYLCYFDESRGHICLLCFPEGSSNRSSAHEDAIERHPIWWIDSTGKKEHSDTLDFEFQLKSGDPGFKHHFFPVQGPGLNQVELEFRGSVYLAAKFSGASLREKRRAGFTKETPETYVLMVEVPSAIRFVGTEILAKLHEHLTKYTDELYLLIEREYLVKKPIKTDEIKKTIAASDDLVCNLMETFRSTLSQISLDLLHGKMKDKLNQQEEMTSSLIADLIRAGILVERKVELVSETHKHPSHTQTSTRLTRIGGKSSEIQMTRLQLLPEDNILEITVRNNSNDCLRNIDAKLIYQTEFFETHSWGTFISFWPAKDELCFQCQRVASDKDGAYVFHLDDENEKLMIRSIKIEKLQKTHS